MTRSRHAVPSSSTPSAIDSCGRPASAPGPSWASWPWRSCLHGLLHLRSFVLPLIVAVVLGMVFEPVASLLARVMPRQVASLLVLVRHRSCWRSSSSWSWSSASSTRAPRSSTRPRPPSTSAATGSPTGASRSSSSRTCGLSSRPSSTRSCRACSVRAQRVLRHQQLPGQHLHRAVLPVLRPRRVGVAQRAGSAPTWACRADLGAGIVEDATRSFRDYFYVLTLSSLPVAVMVWLAALCDGRAAGVHHRAHHLRDLVRALHRRAGLVGLRPAHRLRRGRASCPRWSCSWSSSWPRTWSSPIIQRQLERNALDLHPIVGFGSTIVGSVLFGILGATLSAPTVAMVMRVRERVQAFEEGRAWTPPRWSGSPRAAARARRPPGSRPEV